MATKQVAFRLDEKLLKRVDDYARYLQRKSYWLGKKINRVDAVRVLLTWALDEAITKDPIIEEDDG